MRRMLLTTAVAVAALAAPGTALAHGGRHHGRRHRAHRARVLVFHATRAATPAAPATPATPVTPSSTLEESVGTIASYANETLTVTLNDGTTVSGKVTERTEIECEAPATASAADFGRGDGHGDGQSSSSSGPEGEGSHDGSGDGSGCPGHSAGSEGESSPCTTAALVAGAKVKQAELVLTSTGAVWEKVEL